MAILFNRLPGIADDLPNRAKQINKKTLFDILADTAAETPVDTGRLKTSWQAGPDHVEEEHGTAVEGGTNVEYAAFVEYGTHKMAGRFMLTKAVEAHRQGHADALSKAIGS